MTDITSPYLELLKNRIDLHEIPFTERGSRLLVYEENDHFYIRLAERWIKRDQFLSAYRNRSPILDQLQLTDSDGTPLKLILTTYPHRVVCQTPAGVFNITFLDTETLLVTLPPGRFGVQFQANVNQAQVFRRGGVLRLVEEIWRNIAYTTNARILEHQVEKVNPETHRVRLLLDVQPTIIGSQAALLLNITPRLGFNRYIPDVFATLEAAARRWHVWFSAAPPVLEQYQKQYYFAWWVMRAGLISTRFYTTREAMTPSKMHYVGVWQWDAYFHALAYRYVDMQLAYDQLRIQLDHQTEDGMIPDAIHDEGVVTHLTFPVEADVTKPPLIAWTAWKLHQHQADIEFLNEVYGPIVRWNEWWFQKNDQDQNGLCEYQHPYSSGLDDSPLWDEGTPVESPDLNTYLYLQQEALAKIAQAIGEPEEARMWLERADAILKRMIQSTWDSDSGYFWAKRNGKIINVRTPFNLFPMITGRMPPEINQRLIAHLTDPSQFWPRFPVPSVALNDPHYNPNQMWRGPTWINVNYLLIEGLQRSGFNDLARELRSKTLELMSNRDDIYEYYHPETGENPPQAAPFFGWSSAIFIDLAIQATREEENQ
jgi:putative isomerase